MSKIRALNESSSSSESEDEENPKLSREAEETEIKNLYNSAQLCAINREEEAVVLFEGLLQRPYLNECDDRPLAPVQKQIRLGCLKCLSSLYGKGLTKNVDEGLRVLKVITQLEPNNVNYWYRLGKTALENRDVELSYDAFSSALRCSPGHWGSIENLVTISYVLQDLLGCLRFCSIGLAKDAGFIKGYVFRDHIFKSNLWIHQVIQKNKVGYESLLGSGAENYDQTFKTKYLTEAKDLLHQFTNKKVAFRKQENEESNSTVPCPFSVKKYSFSSLGKLIISVYSYLKKSRKLLNPITLEAVKEIESKEPAEIIESARPSDIQDPVGDQSCTSSQLRSRTSSDEKELPGCCTETCDVDNDDKNTDEMDSQSMSTTMNENGEDEAALRKKSRKDVKWWQKEGQRRSQRVRGNLISAPIKPKPESTFAETLRNIIPVTLLSEEIHKDKDHTRGHQRQIEIPSDVEPYFGTIKEVLDVKQFLAECEQSNIVTLISKFVHLLSKNCKGQWSSDLREVYLELFDLYRSTTSVSSFLNEQDEDLHQIKNYLFAVLTKAELLYDMNLSIDLNCLAVIESSLQKIVEDSNFALRFYWLKAKEYLQMCKDDRVDYSFAEFYLNLILQMLKTKPDTYICFSASEIDFIISSAQVQEKYSFVKKMENLYKIEELYEEKRYDELVDILQFSLSVEAHEDDIENRICLAESYFHLGKVECIIECEKICEVGLKSASEEIIMHCLALLEEIWNVLKEMLSVVELKTIINILLKILIFSEKKQDLINSSIITKPWCFLHAVLFYLERKESIFFIEDDNVPNSILTLQLGHEILSKAKKCCVNDGSLLTYTLTVLMELQHSDEYWNYDETKNCIDQAILCLYSHPNKKFKLKNLKDHGSTGVPFQWDNCLQLYNYFKLDELPEFDSRSNKSISNEVESLFQRIIEEIPTELKPVEIYNKMKDFVEGKTENQPTLPDSTPRLPTFDIFYLLADYYLKSQDLTRAVDLYTWDLAVCPVRFDSWTAIALAKAEDIVVTLNACDTFNVEDVMSNAEAVNRCFRAALNLDPANCKVRIEFGSFLYALHSVYSRELKFHTDKLSIDTFEEIEKRKNEYLLEAQSWFELPPKSLSIEDEIDGHNEEVWINHYMLGKVAEKLHPTEPAKYLEQYEIAAKLLHDKGSPYPAKINYYTPQDYALEALEVYYRTHASILSYVERFSDFNEKIEEQLLNFLRRADESPFIKNKQGRGTEGSESKKKKGVEEISKKELQEVTKVMNHMLDKLETLVIVPEKDSEDSSSSHSSSSTSDSSSSSEECSKNEDKLPPMSSMSLSAFRDRMIELDNLEESKQRQEENTKSKSLQNSQTLDSFLKENKETNMYYNDFLNHPFGVVISICLKAMKECISRYPQCFKAYFRLANSYVLFKKDYKKPREYLLGNNQTGSLKITGLYGERKPSNFFHGIWRNPVDDIERPGSFSFHMGKLIQLLLNILRELNDHQLLADVGLQLAKVPDSKNAYLYTDDREQFSREAIRACAIAAKKSINGKNTDVIKYGKLIYDTYTKFQKHNARDNVVGPALLEAYKKIQEQGLPYISIDQLVLGDAVKYFQHLAWTSKTTGVLPKPPVVNNSIDPLAKQSFVDGSNRNVQNMLQPNQPQRPVAAKKLTSQRRISDQNKQKSQNAVKPNPMNFPNISQISNLFSPDITRQLCLPQNSALFAAYTAQVTNLLNTNFINSLVDKQQQQFFRNMATNMAQNFTGSVDHTTEPHRSKSTTNTAIFSRDMDKTDSNLKSQSGGTGTTMLNLELQKPKGNAIQQVASYNNNDSSSKRQIDPSTASVKQRSKIMPELKKSTPTVTPTTNKDVSQNRNSPNGNNHFPQAKQNNNNTPSPTQLITNLSKAIASRKLQQNKILNPEKPRPQLQVPPLLKPLDSNPVTKPPPLIQPCSPTVIKASTPSPNNFPPMPSMVPAFQNQGNKTQQPKKLLVGSTEITTVSGENQNSQLSFGGISSNKNSYKSPSGTNIVNTTRTKVKKVRQGQTSRNSTVVPMGRDINCTFPNMGGRPYMSSSPFQAQHTAMANPSLTNAPKISPQQQLPQAPRMPLPAHSQPLLNPRRQPQSGEPEVVDLTTKSPDKNTYNSTVESSPEKILGLMSSWSSPSSSTSSKSSDKLYVARSIPLPVPVPLPKSTPSQMPQRPVKRPISTVERPSYYPLPPKKKHHSIPIQKPVDPDPDSDIEVITLE